MLESFIQFCLDKHVRLVAFDFDATALSFDTTPEITFHNERHFHEVYVQGMSTAFKPTVLALQEVGIHVAIVTFNDDILNDYVDGRFNIAGHTLIRPILRELGLANIDIIAWDPRLHDMRAQNGTMTGRNKNSSLKSLQNKYNISRNQDVVLVDDLHKNVHDAIAAGYRVIHVEGDEGFQIEHAVTCLM